MRRLVLIMAVLLLVGCGGDADGDDAGDSEASPTVAGAVVATLSTQAPSTATNTTVAQVASPTAVRDLTPSEQPMPSPTATEIGPTPVVVGSPTADLPLAGEVTATIPVGIFPALVVAGHGSIWVVNAEDMTLSRIDPQTNAIIATIPITIPIDDRVTPTPNSGLGARFDLAIDADSVWVTKPDEQAVAQIDPATNAIIATIHLGANVTAIAISGDTMWVSLFEKASVVRVDTTTHEVVATISNVQDPYGIAIGHDAVWVANHRTNGVTRIDPTTNTVAAWISLLWPGAPRSERPCSLCANEVLANEHGVWVTLGQAYVIARVDPTTNRLATIIPVGVNPESLSSDERGIWVGHFSSAGVLLIDPETNQVTAAVPATDPPYELSYLALWENTIWVARPPTNDVVRVDLRSQ